MTNRCDGLLALSLCGTSVASGKGIEYLVFRKTQRVSWVPGASELSRLKDLCSLCPCTVTKLPTGRQLQKPGNLKLGNKGSPFCSPLVAPGDYTEPVVFLSHT